MEVQVGKDQGKEPEGKTGVHYHELFYFCAFQRGYEEIAVDGRIKKMLVKREAVDKTKEDLWNKMLEAAREEKHDDVDPEEEYVAKYPEEQVAKYPGVLDNLDISLKDKTNDDLVKTKFVQQWDNKVIGFELFLNFRLL